ncbi:MAG: hypothetical protein Q8K99_14405 [Actinomycetota bacterium]|nr:hypothetical protein [Actinomycetota bacterium]
MLIEKASETDLNEVLSVERAAFGREEEAELVRDLLADPSARPLLSLLAREDDRSVGHILFTAAHLEGTPSAATISILAPLAVVSDAWMVRALRPGVVGFVGGTVICADVMNRPENWTE